MAKWRSGALAGGTAALCGAGILAMAAGAGHRGVDMNQPVEIVQYTEDGELIRPQDYRTWVFVGAPLTPNDMNKGSAAFPEFHNVYIDPGAYEAYKQTGEFRDGTVFMKELVSVGTKSSFSGNGYFEGEFLGVEAMVKSRERFPDIPGNWGFFRFTDEEAAREGRLGTPKRTAPNVATSCVGCHAAGAQDRIFTQHYPVLRAARNAKTNPENN
jgi:cytochrome c553